jgi:hypothetical protein
MMSQPSWRARLRPIELLAISAGLALFTGLTVLMATRQIVLALVFVGIAFIVSLVGLAMLALAATPTGEEEAELAEQDAAERSILDRGDDKRNRGSPTGKPPAH